MRRRQTAAATPRAASHDRGGACECGRRRRIQVLVSGRGNDASGERMRLSVVVPVVVLCLCAAVTLASWRARPRAAPAAPRTGMGLLRAYACNRGETKVVLVKGLEDNFSPAGKEPGFLRPGLDKPRWQSVGPGSYDQSQPDHYFIDALRAPARLRNGLFVIGLKPLGVAETDNDVIVLGEPTSPFHFGGGIEHLSSLPGWKQEGSLFSVQLDAVDFGPSSPPDRRTLLDYLDGGSGPRWLDVQVQDDTSVDFIGLAACIRPPDGFGVTLMTDQRQPASGVVSLTCINVPQDWRTCDQYIGDTACTTQLPVACLLPGRRAPPRALSGAGFVGGWSGGDIALTVPVAAARFARIGDVDAFCAARFGEGWRTLTTHDGLPNLGVSGRGHPPAGPVRAWVDEVNQPYGTCWKR